MTSKSLPAVLVNLALMTAGIELAYKHFATQDPMIFSSVIVAVIVGAILLLINQFKKSFGIGDILLILYISVYIEKTQFSIFLLLTLLLASGFSSILLLSDRRWLKRYLPLVPFMFLSLVLSIAYWETISNLFATQLLLW